MSSRLAIRKPILAAFVASSLVFCSMRFCCRHQGPGAGRRCAHCQIDHYSVGSKRRRAKTALTN